jgi:hypothetical protein
LMDCIQSHGESFVLLLGYSGVDSYWSPVDTSRRMHCCRAGKPEE